MRIRRWDMRMGDFLDLVEANRIRINRSYQRSSKVWPLNAKSYLVETVVEELVLPPFMVHAVRGRAGRKGHGELVDGQQRTVALLSFRNDEFRLSDAVDRKALRGRTYSRLSQRDRRSFDRYALRIDRIESATAHDVHEVFRRINYYTAPLNPEEQRHARFQGTFKWFIQEQREVFAPALKSSGVLTEKRIDRMGDAKPLTEIVHAMINGITTTNARSLRKIYSDFDPAFHLSRDFAKRLKAAQRVFKVWGRLPKRIGRNYHGYSLLLALLHALQSVQSLGRLIKRRRPLQEAEAILRNLNILASVLDREDEDDVPSRYRTFHRASQKGTNVRARRATRFRWYYRALTARRV